MALGQKRGFACTGDFWNRMTKTFPIRKKIFHRKVYGAFMASACQMTCCEKSMPRMPGSCYLLCAITQSLDLLNLKATGILLTWEGIKDQS